MIIGVLDLIGGIFGVINMISGHDQSKVDGALSKVLTILSLVAAVLLVLGVQKVFIFWKTVEKN